MKRVIYLSSIRIVQLTHKTPGNPVSIKVTQSYKKVRWHTDILLGEVTLKDRERAFLLGETQFLPYIVFWMC